MKTLVAALALLFMQAPERIQSGVLTGQVRLQDGTPAAGIRIAAMAAQDSGAPEGGTMSLISLSLTDNSGFFRLEGIPPGRYQILAGALDFPTYFPGVKTLAESQTVAVGNGSIVTGLNFNFNLARPLSVSVSGIVPGIPANAPPGLFSVELDPVVGKSGRPPTVLVKADGAFEFQNVLPGSYWVHVAARAPDMHASGDGTGIIHIVVRDSDVAGVIAPFNPVVLGHITVEGGARLPIGAFSPDYDTTRLVGFEASDPVGLGQSPSVRTDGLFVLNLAAGEYQLSPSMLPFGHYVKSMSHGTVDLLQSPLQIVNGENSEIRITLTTAPPDPAASGVTVSGRVTDLPPEPAPGPRYLRLLSVHSSSVWLSGAPPHQVGEALLRPDGSFAVTHVPPGTYSVTLMAEAIRRAWSLPAPIAVLDRDIAGLEIESSTQGIETAANSNVRGIPSRGCVGIECDFNFDQQTRVEGIVKTFSVQNPRMEVVLTVPGRDALDVHFSGPDFADVIGFTPGMIKPGDRIRMIVRPRFDRAGGGFIVVVMTADGQQIRTR